jgi:hypothetical protein
MRAPVILLRHAAHATAPLQHCTRNYFSAAFVGWSLLHPDSVNPIPHSFSETISLSLYWHQRESTSATTRQREEINKDLRRSDASSEQIRVI